MKTTASRPWAYVLAGGLVAGALDILYACGFWWWKAGVPAPRILQSVAAGEGLPLSLRPRQPFLDPRLHRDRPGAHACNPLCRSLGCQVLRMAGPLLAERSPRVAVPARPMEVNLGRPADRGFRWRERPLVAQPRFPLVTDGGLVQDGETWRTGLAKSTSLPPASAWPWLDSLRDEVQKSHLNRRNIISILE